MVSNSLFSTSIGERVRELLEDFDIIATLQHAVVVPNSPHQEALRKNAHAAVVATTLRLSSIDYAKRRYCDRPQDDVEQLQSANPLRLYINAYHSAKSYIIGMQQKLVTDGRPSPEMGVFGSSLALERLPASFFSAHLLYRLGQRYEGHAVSRLILEQIAWAYAAHLMTDINNIETIETTKAISQLKQIAPDVGKLYGFLSKKTHIDHQSHREFLAVADGQNMVLHAQAEHLEYARVILQLADLFGLVWELSQTSYIEEPETIVRTSSGSEVRNDRPFLKKMCHHLETIEKAMAHK